MNSDQQPIFTSEHSTGIINLVEKWRDKTDSDQAKIYI